MFVGSDQKQVGSAKINVKRQIYACEQAYCRNTSALDSLHCCGWRLGWLPDYSKNGLGVWRTPPLCKPWPLTSVLNNVGFHPGEGRRCREIDEGFRPSYGPHSPMRQNIGSRGGSWRINGIKWPCPWPCRFVFNKKILIEQGIERRTSRAIKKWIEITIQLSSGGPVLPVRTLREVHCDSELWVWIDTAFAAFHQLYRIAEPHPCLDTV